MSCVLRLAPVFCLLTLETCTFAASYDLQVPTPGWKVVATIDPDPVLLDSCALTDDMEMAIVAMNDPFTITVKASYANAIDSGTTMLNLSSVTSDTSVVWSRLDDCTVVTTVHPGQERLVNNIEIPFRASVEYQDSNETSRASFSGGIYVYKEIGVDMSSPSRSMLDFDLIRPDGITQLGYPKITSVNGGHIKVIDSGPFTISPTSMVTGPKEYDSFRDDGTASAAITAPLSSTVDKDGYINGSVTLSASDDSRHSTQDFYIRLPFAIPEDVHGYVTLQSREDVLMSPRPLVEGEILRPGDVIEVVAYGSENGDLILRFCDGHQARIQSHWGTRIQLGTSHGVDSERSSIHFWLSNAAFDVSQNPREYGRVIIYKTISEGAANALVPGGGAARYIFRKTVGKGVQYTLKRSGSGSQMAPRAMSALAVDLYSPAATYISASIYSDGNMRIESGDGSLDLTAGTNATALPAGASVMVNLDADQPTISGLAANDPGGPGSTLQWSVSDYTVLSNRTPYLEIRYPSGEGAFRLNSMECRINGMLASANLTVRPTVAELRVPPGLALHAGTNHLEAAVTCISGSRSVADVNVVVDGSVLPPAPESLEAQASTNGVWLTWRPNRELSLVGYHVYGADAEAGPFVRLTTDPCSVAAWLDQTVSGPQATQRWYAVETVFAGATSLRSSPVQAKRAPALSELPAIALEPLADGIRITPTNTLAHFWPCRVERAVSDQGPWTAVASGQFFGSAGMLDTTAHVGEDYWYRPVVLNSNASQVAGLPVGPVQRPDVLASLPTGVTAWRENGHVTLRWDPSDEPSLAGYHVYRSQGAGFVALNTQLVAGPMFTDSSVGNGDHQWRIVPVSTNGIEGPGAAEIDLAWWEPTGPVGEFKVAPTQVGATEAHGFVDVEVQRVNGASDSAFVTYTTSSNTWHAAEPGADYEPMGGTLVFGPGETNKTLRVNLVNDGVQEDTERLALNLTSASSGALIDWWTPADSALVYIFDGSVVPPPVVNGSTNFTVSAGKMFHRSILADNMPDRFVADTPPVWLTVDTRDGLLSGTPDTPGFFDVPITIANFGASTTVTFRIQVTGSPVLNWQSHQVGSSRWLGAHYANGRYLLCGAGGALGQSTNGNSWATSASGVSNALNAVTYAANQWMVVGDSGKILTSPNAATWTPRTSGVSIPLLGITGGAGQVVAVGYELTILSSADGASWTARKSGGFNPLAGVVFGGSRFVAAGGLAWGDPAGYVSLNAANWTAIDPGGGNPGSGFDDIAYGGGRYVVVGASGRIFSSTNTTNWSQETSGTTQDLHAIGYSDGLFVAVGDNGAILVSSDGRNWSPSHWAGSQSLSAVTGGRRLFVIGGAGGLVLTAALRLDSDGDGMSDADEATAGTDPLDRKSVFKIVAADNGSPDGFVMRWTSCTGRTYSVLYTDDISTPFRVLHSNVPGQADYTEITDSTTTTNGVRFYKVAVRP